MNRFKRKLIFNLTVLPLINDSEKNISQQFSMKKHRRTDNQIAGEISLGFCRIPTAFGSLPTHVCRLRGLAPTHIQRKPRQILVKVFQIEIVL